MKFLVLGIFLGIVGLLMLIKPSLVWSLTEQWKSDEATEPSDLYVFSIRFGGTICVTIAVISLLLFFINPA